MESAALSWPEMPLGKLFTMASGGTPSKAKAEYWGGEIPWVSGKDLYSDRIYDSEDHVTEEGARSGTRYAQPGTLLLLVRGMALLNRLPLAEVMRPVTFNQDVKALTCVEGVSSRFLFYLLSSLREVLIGSADEAAHGTKRLQTDRLVSLKVRVPPLQIQQRIASCLSFYDDLIETNTRRIRVLEEMARLLYREWFDELRIPLQTEGEDHPSNWPIRKLGEVVELAYGKALKSSDRQTGPVPVFGSSGIVGTHDTALVSGPGVILGRKGNVGSTFWSMRSFYPIDTVYYVISSLPLTFVYHFLLSQRFLNSDSAVPGLSRQQAYSLPIRVPASSVLARFDEFAFAILKQVDVLLDANARLRATRDLLLPRLLSGKLDVSRIPDPAELAQ